MVNRWIAVLAGAMALASVVPASADAKPGLWIRNGVGAGFCLDSNARGSVYLNQCQRGNRYQLWQVWNRGWTRNVATGRCLEQVERQRVRTSPCAKRPTQYWRHWNGGWYQRPAYAGKPAACLAHANSAHGVMHSRCGDPYHPTAPVKWFVHLP